MPRPRETLRPLRAQPNPPQVIVLTIFDADELVLRALQAGAAGFLFKDSAAADIVAAIQAGHDAWSKRRRFVGEDATQQCEVLLI